MRKVISSVVIALGIVYFSYLMASMVGIGTLAKSINDFQRKIEKNACVKIKSVRDC